MTILSKEALEKIRNERAARGEEDADDINRLYQELEQKLQESKVKKEEYNPFAEGDFDSFDPKEK